VSFGGSNSSYSGGTSGVDTTMSTATGNKVINIPAPPMNIPGGMTGAVVALVAVVGAVIYFARKR
jgi:hypothetical protein